MEPISIIILCSTVAILAISFGWCLGYRAKKSQAEPVEQAESGPDKYDRIIIWQRKIETAIYEVAGNLNTLSESLIPDNLKRSLFDYFDKYAESIRLEAFEAGYKKRVLEVQAKLDRYRETKKTERLKELKKPVSEVKFNKYNIHSKKINDIV